MVISPASAANRQFDNGSVWRGAVVIPDEYNQVWQNGSVLVIPAIVAAGDRDLVYAGRTQNGRLREYVQHVPYEMLKRTAQRLTGIKYVGAHSRNLEELNFDSIVESGRYIGSCASSVCLDREKLLGVLITSDLTNCDRDGKPLALKWLEELGHKEVSPGYDVKLRWESQDRAIQLDRNPFELAAVRDARGGRDVRAILRDSEDLLPGLHLVDVEKANRPHYFSLQDARTMPTLDSSQTAAVIAHLMDAANIPVGDRTECLLDSAGTKAEIPRTLRDRFFGLPPGEAAVQGDAASEIAEIAALKQQLADAKAQLANAQSPEAIAARLRDAKTTFEQAQPFLRDAQFDPTRGAIDYMRDALTNHYGQLAATNADAKAQLDGLGLNPVGIAQLDGDRLRQEFDRLLLSAPPPQTGNGGNGNFATVADMADLPRPQPPSDEWSGMTLTPLPFEQSPWGGNH